MWSNSCNAVMLLVGLQERLVKTSCFKTPCIMTRVFLENDCLLNWVYACMCQWLLYTIDGYILINILSYLIIYSVIVVVCLQGSDSCYYTWSKVSHGKVLEQAGASKPTCTKLQGNAHLPLYPYLVWFLQLYCCVSIVSHIQKCCVYVYYVIHSWLVWSNLTTL